MLSRMSNQKKVELYVKEYLDDKDLKLYWDTEEVDHEFGRKVMNIVVSEYSDTVDASEENFEDCSFTMNQFCYMDKIPMYALMKIRVQNGKIHIVGS